MLHVLATHYAAQAAVIVVSLVVLVGGTLASVREHREHTQRQRRLAAIIKKGP